MVRDPNGAADWKQQLTEAFEVLLDAPLGDFDPDARYATFFGGNMINEIGYDRDPGWFRPAALGGAEAVVWDFGESPLVFDAAASIFELHRPRDAFPAEFAADLENACFTPGLIRGADLAPLLDRHGVDLTGPEWADKRQVAYPVLASDGTLYDALRVALGLGHGPESLVDHEAEVSEEWEEALEAVEDPALRAHLGFYCTDGEDGLMYLQDDRTAGGLLVEEGCELIANWEEGQSQVEFAVVKLGDLLAGPRPRP
ncbi:hypothetical protein [Actinosynnema sp. NPDC020468]|uniref:hypothetical protein n=1 Tax=Actinosynnema sp. NPDC020468 TaxID=3154488 RepID=UPI003408A8F8